MPEDPIARRFERRRKEHQLGEIAKRSLPREDLEAEEKLLNETKKVDPIRAERKPDRNAPCPCGSGKKYKKCCGAK